MNVLSFVVSASSQPPLPQPLLPLPLPPLPLPPLPLLLPLLLPLPPLLALQDRVLPRSGPRIPLGAERCARDLRLCSGGSAATLGASARLGRRAANFGMHIHEPMRERSNTLRCARFLPK